MRASQGWYPRWGKRVFDLCAVVLTLPLWLPFIGLLALVMRVTLGSPVFFRQARPGLCGRPFTLLKLRTMSQERDADGGLLTDEHRLGRFGRALRSASLDELPTLWNVMRGDMSLVGPRPLLVQYLHRYTTGQRRRHEVRPGVTGWAQVNGRNAISWEEKFEFDVWYVDNTSLRLDLKILRMTLVKVVRGEGVSAVGQATMPEFVGTGRDQNEG